MDPVDPWYLLFLGIVLIGALIWQTKTQGDPFEDGDRG